MTITKTNLPTGIYSLSDWDNNVEVPSMYEATNLTNKVCTCGCHKTYGLDCDPSYHSDYCELYKKKEE